MADDDQPGASLPGDRCQRCQTFELWTRDELEFGLCARCLEVKFPAPDKIRSAIKETQYKYFGDYELSPDQWEAVWTLVGVAQAYLRTREK